MELSPVARRLLRWRHLQRSSQAISNACARAIPLVSGQDRHLVQIAAHRISHCVSSFRVWPHTPPGEETQVMIRHPEHCSHPLCFLCARAKSIRMRKKIVEVINTAHQIAPQSPLILLTVTIRNRPWRELELQLDELAAGMLRFWKLPPIKRSYIGSITSFEIVCRGSPDAPEAGGHAHILVAAHPEYYSKDRDLYLRQRALTDLYGQALQVDYKPMLFISPVRSPDGGVGASSIAYAVKEVCKYCVKPQELFTDGNRRLVTDPTVIAILAKALYRRRMIRLRGVFSKASKIRNQKLSEAETDM